jgi:hypothetical protein
LLQFDKSALIAVDRRARSTSAATVCAPGRSISAIAGQRPPLNLLDFPDFPISTWFNFDLIWLPSQDSFFAHQVYPVATCSGIRAATTSVGSDDEIALRASFGAGS